MVSREDVIAAYRMLLGRVPEGEEAIAFHMRHPSVEELRRAIMTSTEFAMLVRERSGNVAWVTPDAVLPPPNEVVVHATPEQEAAMWAQTAANWQMLGEEAPHYSVVSLDRFRPDAFEANRAEFEASGADDARLVEIALARFDDAETLTAGLCIEVGCGVGRVTGHLARIFARVLGLDISAAHLEHARAALVHMGASNADFAQVRLIDDYAALPAPSFVFSRFVLHHNPPTVQAAILARLLDRLASPGAMLFQAVGSMDNYRFSPAGYLATRKTGMEMHVLPQREIFRIIGDAGCALVEVQRDDTAALEEHLRSFFYLVRKG